MNPNADDAEFSESGAPIYHHKPRQRGFQLAGGDEQTIARVEQHIARHIGKPKFVFHELISDLVHVDVHLVEPTPERSYYTLVTSGMSDRPMNVPPGAEAFRSAELLICLPPDWPLTQEAFQDETNYWPIRWLKLLARLPHEYDTWLGELHTVPNGDPARPFADGTELCCMMLARPVLFGPEAWQAAVDADRAVQFYSLVPLYREEMEWKLRHGADALLELLDKHGVTELLDVGRPNVCASRARFFSPPRPFPRYGRPAPDEAGGPRQDGDAEHGI
jgi:hypothetical protein